MVEDPDGRDVTHTPSTRMMENRKSCPPPCAPCWPAGFFGAGGCLPIWHGVGGFATNSQSSLMENRK